MFVKLYKTGYIFHAFSIIIIAVILYLPYFLVPQNLVPDSYETSLFGIYIYYIGCNYYVNILGSFLIVIFGGLIINNLLMVNEISAKTSMLGFFFFVLLNSSISSNIIINQFLVSSFFILLMVNTLFKIPKTEDTIPIAFNASLFLGLAGVFYYPSLLLIFIIWIALMIFSVSSWREYFITIIGVFIPLFFTSFGFYYIDNFESFYEGFISAFHFDFELIPISNMEVIIDILLVGIILPMLVKLAGSLMEKSIVVRQKLSFSIWLLIFSFFVIILFDKHALNGILISVPITIILTNVASESKKLKWLDLYIGLIFILVFVNHYLVFF